jgi:HK97 family phage portal protein
MANKSNKTNLSWIKKVSNVFGFGKNKIETKDAFVNDQLGLSIFPSGDKPILYANESVLYMIECAPVATAIDMHAKAVATIPAKVLDTETMNFVDHPVLELLQYPNADQTFSEFMEAIVQWYDGTGNVYLTGLGFVERPPQTIRVMPSVTTTIITGIDGYAQTFTTRLLGIADTYSRTIVENYGRERFRYYANDFNELYHMRTFNPLVGSNMVYGLSPLNAIFYEMRQYVDSAKFNLSVLQRASKLSGVWYYDGILTDKQRQEYQYQINNAYSGSNNAGRNALLDKRMSFTDLMKTARDMEYSNTAKFTAEAIYKALKIPLPLVNSESMTFSNYESSQYSFYKNAVVPTRRRIDQELTNWLMPRYDNKNNRYVITFNPRDVAQLEPERNEQTSLMKNTGIYTINEMRKENEYKAIEGGQYIYGTMGSLPIATDPEDEFTTEDSLNTVKPLIATTPTTTEQQTNITESMNPKEPPDGTEAKPNQNDIDGDRTKASREKFIERLKRQTNRDGSQRFNDEDINALVDKHYGR